MAGLRNETFKPILNIFSSNKKDPAGIASRVQQNFFCYSRAPEQSHERISHIRDRGLRAAADAGAKRVLSVASLFQFSHRQWIVDSFPLLVTIEGVQSPGRS